MEHASCNIIYVDRRIRQDRCIRSNPSGGPVEEEWESEHIAANVKLLADVLGEVHLCSTGGACLTQWLNFQDTSMIDLKPTLILIDTPFEDRFRSHSRTREPSPHSLPEDSDDQEEELYGLALLQRIVQESVVRNFSKLVIPVSLVVFPSDDFLESTPENSEGKEETLNGSLHPQWSKNRRPSNRRLVQKCLDMGATDVMASPMNGHRITTLEVHAYRAHREAAREQKALLEVRRGRKRSWVGFTEEKPYAYLREAMVSSLMNGICRMDLGVDDAVSRIRVSVPTEKQALIAAAVGKWHFCAHDFSDDELIVAASTMFKHALSMPELEQWRIPTDQLHSFLIATRAAYNEFVPYHNFRHVVDVLQATFNFLIRIGSLPPLGGSLPDQTNKSHVAELLDPHGALTLLVTAIGHDVGHPGVNNGFLVKLSAPLAQLYNDQSVLEMFHCAAYSQILRRYWPSTYSDEKMRQLMIVAILATDMGVHNDFMNKMSDLQDKLKDKRRKEEEEGVIEDFNGRAVEEQRQLACALLIKCADISNVARQYDTAVQWMQVLSDEFSRQATMEEQLDIPTSLFAPPKKDAVSLIKSQLGFMNVFALPLFQGVADLLPPMQYCVEELETNKQLFEKSVQEEQEKQEKEVAAGERPLQREGTFSPRTMSFAANPEAGRNTPSTTKEFAPSPLVTENGSSTEKEFVMAPSDASDKPKHASGLSNEVRVNGIVTSFDAVANFVQSDPFNLDHDIAVPIKQRCSETTESSSAPYPGDSASQATSATTGKMPLSPSTQGTSIISRDSLDRPISGPATTTTMPESTTTVSESMISQPEIRLDLVTDDMVNGFSKGKAKCSETEAADSSPKSLKKKPSRFRLNALALFRKHKTPSPPLHAADTAAG